jgi:hypothetical protein
VIPWARRILALSLVLAACEPATGPQFERIARLEVAAELVECSYISGPPQCLVVRWDHAGPWAPLAASVQGFSFEAGHTYVLDVALFSWRGPRNIDQEADIRLVHVVRKQRVPSA